MDKLIWWLQCLLYTEKCKRNTGFRNNDVEGKLQERYPYKPKKNEKHLDLGYRIEKMVNGKTKFNLTYAYLLLDYWDFDISKALNVPAEFLNKYPPKNKGISIENDYHLIARCKKSQNNLTNGKYSGKYYGYMYPTNGNTTKLDKFELTISADATHPSAEVTITSQKKHFNGTPTVFEKNMLYMVLEHTDGSYFILSVHYADYKTTHMQFKYGIVITNSRCPNSPPVFQSAVISKEPIIGKDDVIRGILKLGGNNFLAPSKAFDDLDEKTKEALHNSEVITCTKVNYAMLEPASHPISPEIFESIMKLKSQSPAADYFIYPDRYDYYNWAKYDQPKEKEEEEEEEEEKQN